NQPSSKNWDSNDPISLLRLVLVSRVCWIRQASRPAAPSSCLGCNFLPTELSKIASKPANVSVSRPPGSEPGRLSGSTTTSCSCWGYDSDQSSLTSPTARRQLRATQSFE